MGRLTAVLMLPVAVFLTSCGLIHHKAAPAGMGQEVIDGKLAFIVNQVTTSPTFGKTRAQGVYVIVSMAVRNVGTEMQYFKMDAQTLKDTAGRQYSPSFMDPPVLEEINNIDPSVQMSLKLAFDVPPDVHLTQIVLHESASSQGVQVHLTKPSAPAATTNAPGPVRE